MLKILLTVFIFANFGYSQTPTPTPIITAEQKAKTAELRKSRLAAEKLLPTKMSAPLYSKYESITNINMFLTSYHAKFNKANSAKMEICFDLTQHFQSENDAQNSSIEDAFLVIDRTKILFKLPNEDIPSLQEGFPKNHFFRYWKFRITFSDQELLLLRNARKVFVKWNKGRFEVNKNNLEITKEFIEEELSNFLK